MTRELDTVVFSHGKESGPWGSKISAMAETARGRGLRVESVDYRGIEDPGERVEKLVAECAGYRTPPLLVGSSMGGHVAAAAARQVTAGGLFLIAPAFFMPGYEDLTPEPARCPTLIVHGWDDQVVPVDNSIRYARSVRVSLMVIDGGHRLTERIPLLTRLLDGFIDELSL